MQPEKGTYIPPHPIVPMLIEDKSTINILNIIFFSCLIGPITEEIVFRGVFYPFLRKNLGVVLAAVLTSLCFSLMHMNIMLVPVIFVTGILFAYLYERSGSLVPGIFVHVMHNTFMVLWVLMIKTIV